MQKIILKWLDNKVNYIGLKPKEDSNLKFQCKFSQLITYSRVNKEYLKPSTCYLIVNGESTKYNKITRNSTFENFNLKINEYPITITSICFLLKVLFKKDTHKVIVNSAIYSILDEVKQYFSIKNNYILDKEDKLDIFKTFFNKYSPDNINFKDIRDNKLVLDEFKQDLENLSKLGCNRLNKIGIFYPFKYDIDIFKENFYLLDLNLFKLYNKQLDLYQVVNSFYKRGLNANIKTLMTLERYFIHHAFTNNFAYFNPFQYKKIHSENHKKLLKYVASKGFDQDKFTVEFFDFLNLLQYASVSYQYRELIPMISVYHYTNGLKDKNYTLKQVIKQYKDTNQIFQKIYDALNEKNIRKKRVCADDLGFQDEKTKIIINEHLNIIYSILGRNENLMNLYQEYIEKSKVRFKKYQFNKNSQKIINQIIKDLILWYDELTEENMKKRRVNPFLHKIYDKYKKKDIVNIIDFDRMDKFIKKYSNQFNTIIPSKIADSSYIVIH